MSYTIIQNEVIVNKNLSDGAFRVLSFLNSMCYGEKESCYPSQQYIADKLNKSVRTVQRYISELEEAGLIKKKRRGSISNVYYILSKVTQNIHSKTKKLVEKARENVQKNYKKKKESIFNNFKQRNYDFKALEDMLLGRKKYNAQGLYKLE